MIYEIYTVKDGDVLEIRETKDFHEAYLTTQRICALYEDCGISAVLRTNFRKDEIYATVRA